MEPEICYHIKADSHDREKENPEVVCCPRCNERDARQSKKIARTDRSSLTGCGKAYDTRDMTIGRE